MPMYKVTFKYTCSAIFQRDVEADSPEAAIDLVEEHECFAGTCDFEDNYFGVEEEYQVDGVELLLKKEDT